MNERDVHAVLDAAAMDAIAALREIAAASSLTIGPMTRIEAARTILSLWKEIPWTEDEEES